jgi:enhanced entry protein EnhC
MKKENTMKTLAPWLYLVAATYSYSIYAADGLDAYRQGNYNEAGKLLTQQTSDDAVVNYYLGRMQLYGYGLLKNNASALDSFTKSANKGYLPAQQLLAHYYLLGAKEPNKAFTWFKAAAEGSEDLKAQMYCSAAYIFGYGVKKNPELAKRYYIAAAKNGNAIAQYELAIQFLDSRNGSNKKLGVIWLSKSAAQNNPKALYTLAQLYDSAKFMAKDPVKAKGLMEQAAKQQYLPAMLYLAQQAIKQGDYNAAKPWLIQANNTNDLDAKVAMAQFLTDAKNPMQDYKAGFSGMWKAAQAGSQLAQESLATLYKEGRGVEANPSLAEKWKEAALKTESNKKPDLPPVVEVARWLSNDKANTLPDAGYTLGGIYNAWQNKIALKENNYNQPPQMDVLTRQALYRPQFKLVQPNTIPISEYFDILAPMLNANPSKNWVFPRYPVDKQISAVQRHASLILQHQQGISVIDDGASYLVKPDEEKPFDYFAEKTRDWEYKLNLQRALNRLYGQAILGESAAQFELGQLYQYGLGVAQNIEQALAYYQLAAAQQEIRAEYNIAVLYLEGKTNPVDYKKGVDWMTDAAFKGNPYAQYALANLYENGFKDATGKDIITPNHEQAMAMFHLASANHFPEAEYRLADFLVRENNNSLSVVVKQNRINLIKRLYANAAQHGISEAIVPLAFYNAMDPNPLKQKHAFAVAKAQAEAGNSEAALLLGIMYERGITVPVNQSESIRWYQQAAVNPVSAFILGTYYAEGTGVSKDTAKARELLQQSGNAGFSYANLNLGILKHSLGELFINDLDKARNQGNSKAGLLLADYYLTGASTPDKMKQSRDIYQHFAQKGDKDAQLKLGFLFDKGLGGEINNESAAQWYSSAAEQGQPIAQYLLGQLYQLGKIGKHPDYVLAKKWYEAARNSYAPASVALGFVYDTVDDNYLAAFTNYSLASKAGDSVGKYDLGIMYEYGKGMPVDLKRAKSLFTDAADHGFTSAMTKLGALYLHEDPKQAIVWYQKAADLGDGAASYQLGLFFERGVSTKVDLKKALQNYQKASDLGHEKATFELARMYQHGIGVEKNYAKAGELYKKLASQDNANAQYQLALAYLNGAFGERSPEQAKTLLQQASKNGNKEAEKTLNWLNSQIN